MSESTSAFLHGTSSIAGLETKINREYTQKEVADNYLAALAPFVRIFNYADDTEAPASLITDSDVSQVHDAIELLKFIATEGITIDGKSWFPTARMTDQLDLLFRSLGSVGININDPTTVTKENVQKWRDLAQLSPVIQDVLTNAVDAGKTAHRSLQSLIELEYVVTGHKIIADELDELEVALGATKEVMDSLSTLQNLHNEIDVVGRGSDVFNYQNASVTAVGNHIDSFYDKAITPILPLDGGLIKVLLEKGKELAVSATQSVVGLNSNVSLSGTIYPRSGHYLSIGDAAAGPVRGHPITGGDAHYHLYQQGGSFNLNALYGTLENYVNDSSLVWGRAEPTASGYRPFHLEMWDTGGWFSAAQHVHEGNSLYNRGTDGRVITNTVSGHSWTGIYDINDRNKHGWGGDKWAYADDLFEYMRDNAHDINQYIDDANAYNRQLSQLEDQFPSLDPNIWKQFELPVFDKIPSRLIPPPDLANLDEARQSPVYEYLFDTYYGNDWNDHSTTSEQQELFNVISTTLAGFQGMRERIDNDAFSIDIIADDIEHVSRTQALDFAKRVIDSYNTLDENITTLTDIQKEGAANNNSSLLSALGTVQQDLQDSHIEGFKDFIDGLNFEVNATGQVTNHCKCNGWYARPMWI